MKGSRPEQAVLSRDTDLSKLKKQNLSLKAW